MIDRIKKLLEIPIVSHIIFWLIIFSIMVTSKWEYFSGSAEAFTTYGLKIGLQAVVAYLTIGILIPWYKAKKQLIPIIFSYIIMFFIINLLYTLARMYYLEVEYAVSYPDYLRKHGHLSLNDRLFNLKSVLLHVPLFYIQPTLILIAIQYYRKQQELLALNEQRKTAELKSLKNQLNPHFLFNTLNNLYALALKNSDQTPEVISRLSDILDYMLYRCNDKYVSLNKEVEHIENYLALEQVRYGDRVNVNFHQSIDLDVKIAPLIILTFLENAFKHGVSQELKKATIDIRIKLTNNLILFSILNTKPAIVINNNDPKTPIGLINVKKQLEMLYPEGYKLDIKSEIRSYKVTLTIPIK